MLKNLIHLFISVLLWPSFLSFLHAECTSKMLFNNPHNKKEYTSCLITITKNNIKLKDIPATEITREDCLAYCNKHYEKDSPLHLSVFGEERSLKKDPTCKSRDIESYNDLILFINQYKAISSKPEDAKTLENTFKGCTFFREKSYLKSKISDKFSPELIKQLEGSLLVHGSSSASLLSFTDYGRRQGDLLATGALSLLGKVPFGGEMGQGISKYGINKVALSTAPAHEINASIRYALSNPWSPTIAKSRLERYAGRKELMVSSKMEELRLLHWNTLNEQEKSLVQDSFPVLYAITPRDYHLLTPVKSDIPELALTGGVFADEIKVIFVPQDKIELVSDIVKKSKTKGILVKSLEEVKEDIKLSKYEKWDLENMIDHENLIKLNELYQKGFNFDDVIKDTELTPLYYAVLGKRELALKFLLSKAKVNVDKKSNYVGDEKESALNFAIRTQKLDMAKLLLEYKANPNILDGKGFSAVDYASEKKSEEMINFYHFILKNGGEHTLFTILKEGFTQEAEKKIEEANNINQKDLDGASLLQLAIRSNNPQLVEKILARDPELNSFDNYGKTSLTDSMKLQDKTIFKKLLQRKSLDLNAGSPLLLRDVSFETKKELIDAGANVNSSHPESKTTYLMMSCFAGDVEALQYLLKRPDIQVQLKNISGKTALTYAYQGMEKASGEKKKDYEAIIRLLKEAGLQK